jgi:hypothetical protein
LHWMWCYTIWSPEVGSHDMKECTQHHLTGGCLWLNFCGHEVGYLKYMPTDFLVGYATSRQPPHMPQKCITLHLVPVQIFQWYSHAMVLWYVSVKVGPTGNTFCDIQDTTQLHELWLHSYLFHWQGTNGQMSVLTYNISDSCNILNISDNVSLSWSRRVCHSLLAHSKW